MPKLTQLPAASAVVATDIVPIVDDPSGTAVTQKATFALVRSYVLGISSGVVTFPEASVAVNNALAQMYVIPTDANYTGSAYQSIVTRAASTLFDHFYATADGVVMFRVRGNGNVVMGPQLALTNLGSGTRVDFPGLPTSSPGTSGSVWNNAGVLNIVP